MTRIPDALTLLDELKQAGAIIAKRGDQLIIQADAGTLTPDRLGAMKSRKAELLAMLSGDYGAAADALWGIEDDPDRRADLIESHEERLAICGADDDASAGAAEVAYRQLCRMIGDEIIAQDERRATIRGGDG